MAMALALEPLTTTAPPTMVDEDEVVSTTTAPAPTPAEKKEAVSHHKPLECMVCFETYSLSRPEGEPRSLCCGHTLCYACCVKAANLHVDGIQCPVRCSVKLTLLPDLIVPRQLIEVMEGARVPVSQVEACMSCEEKATLFCGDCHGQRGAMGADLCDLCSSLYHGPTQKLNAHHRPIPLRLKGQTARHCPIHMTQPLRFWCKECQECICADCEKEDAHSSHPNQIVLPKNALPKIRELAHQWEMDLAEESKKIASRNKSILLLKTTVEKWSAEARQMLTTEAALARTCIEKRHFALSTQLKTQFDVMAEAVQRYECRFAECSNDSFHLKETAAILMNLDTLSFLHGFQDFNKKCLALKETCAQVLSDIKEPVLPPVNTELGLLQYFINYWGCIGLDEHKEEKEKEKEKEKTKVPLTTEELQVILSHRKLTTIEQVVAQMLHAEEEVPQARIELKKALEQVTLLSAQTAAAEANLATANRDILALQTERTVLHETLAAKAEELEKYITQSPISG